MHPVLQWLAPKGTLPTAEQYVLTSCVHAALLPPVRFPSSGSRRSAARVQARVKYDRLFYCAEVAEAPKEVYPTHTRARARSPLASANADLVGGSPLQTFELAFHCPARARLLPLH